MKLLINISCCLIVVFTFTSIGASDSSVLGNQKQIMELNTSFAKTFNQGWRDGYKKAYPMGFVPFAPFPPFGKTTMKMDLEWVILKVYKINPNLQIADIKN